MSRIKIAHFLKNIFETKINQCKTNNIVFFYLGITFFISLSTQYLIVKLKEDKNRHI